jgi:hypothetical protein
VTRAAPVLPARVTHQESIAARSFALASSTGRTYLILSRRFQYARTIAGCVGRSMFAVVMMTERRANGDTDRVRSLSTEFNVDNLRRIQQARALVGFATYPQ